MLLNFDSTLAALTADIGFVMVDVRFAFAAPDKVLSRLRLLAAGDLVLGSLSSLLPCASHTGLTAAVKFSFVTRPMGTCCFISSQHMLMSTSSMRETRVKSLRESCGRAVGSISPCPRSELYTLPSFHVTKHAARLHSHARWWSTVSEFWSGT
jgi:hypothetical protein